MPYLNRRRSTRGVAEEAEGALTEDVVAGVLEGLAAEGVEEVAGEGAVAVQGNQRARSAPDQTSTTAYIHAPLTTF